MRIKLINKNELNSEDYKIKKVMGRTYLIIHTETSHRIIEFMCRHQFTSLDSGRIDGDIVTCPRHGWKYNIKTGECIVGNGIPLKVCEFEEDGEWIYLTLNLGENENNYQA